MHPCTRRELLIYVRQLTLKNFETDCNSAMDIYKACNVVIYISK